MNRKYIFLSCMWMGTLGEGGVVVVVVGERLQKTLNMLFPWGHTAACDLEKQSRVMGILKKCSGGGGGGCGGKENPRKVTQKEKKD